MKSSDRMGERERGRRGRGNFGGPCSNSELTCSELKVLCHALLRSGTFTFTGDRGPDRFSRMGGKTGGAVDFWNGAPVQDTRSLVVLWVKGTVPRVIF